MKGLCYNNNGVDAQNSTRQNGLIIITKGLLEAEENILSDAINNYFTAVNLASLPYIKAADSYKALSIINPLTKFYFDGSSTYPTIGTSRAVTFGNPTFNETGLANIETGKAAKINIGDQIKFGVSSTYNFSKANKWTVECLIKYTTVGSFILKSSGGVGWAVGVDTDGRLIGQMTVNVGADDYVQNKSTEVLTAGTIYHVVCQFDPSIQNGWSTRSTPKIVIFIDGREQISYPQYDIKSIRALTGDITSVGNLSIGDTAFSGTIDELAIYSGLGLASKLQARAFMAVNSFTIPTWTKPTSVTNLILDQDIDTDVDDAGDIHTAISLKRLGKVNLLADIVSTASPYAAPAAKAISEWWSDNTLIAQYQGSSGRSYPLGSDLWPAQAREQFRPTDIRTNYPADVVTYRTLLAASDDNSVVIVTTGYLISVQGLMNSPADGISPLTGMQLITTKVNCIFIVDNFYPSGTVDAAHSIAYNGSGHASSWKDVIENAPCKIIFAGAEFALAIMRQAKINDPDDYLTNPFRFAYKFKSIGARPCWGVLPVMMATNGMEDKFILSYPFTQTINGTTGAADNLVYSPTGNRWFMRYADGFDKAYSGNALSAEVDTIFAMDNTTNPAT